MVKSMNSRGASRKSSTAVRCRYCRWPCAVVGSLLTRGNGNPFHRSFKRGLFSRLELVVGEPVAAAEASPEYLKQRVADLRGEWK